MSFDLVFPLHCECFQLEYFTSRIWNTYCFLLHYAIFGYVIFFIYFYKILYFLVLNKIIRIKDGNFKRNVISSVFRHMNPNIRCHIQNVIGKLSKRIKVILLDPKLLKSTIYLLKYSKYSFFQFLRFKVLFFYVLKMKILEDLMYTKRMKNKDICFRRTLF